MGPGRSSQGPGRSWQAKTPPAPSTVNAAGFTPPWHSKQKLDVVTGATPKVMSFNQAIEIVSPSVVGINTSGGQDQSASGIIVHREGYIITNNHVVKGAENITVTLGYDSLIKSYPAKIIDSREDLDLALIKITPTDGTVLVPAPLGDSDKILIGQDVLAIGNPFGLAQSASAGIISNPRRHITTVDNRVFEDIIQTDASINPGSSGGPLVNTKAEVIGVNTAIYSPVQGFIGVAFAVPINQARKVFQDFIQVVPSPLAGGDTQAGRRSLNMMDIPEMGANLKLLAGAASRSPTLAELAPGKVSGGRCWLGIEEAFAADSMIAQGFRAPFRQGVWVSRVFAASPAQKAGLQRGDVIYRVDDRRVKDAGTIWSYLEGKKAGDKVKITLFRNNEKQNHVLALEPEPSNIRSLLSQSPQGSPVFQAVAMTAPSGALPSPREQNAAGKEFIEGHWLGLEVIPLDAELATEYQIPEGQSGVLVDEVTLESAESGILAGDMVQSIGGFPTPDLRAFFQATQRVQEKERAQVEISRRGANMTFFMTARNTSILGFAQMEAAQPIQPSALRPHRYIGACTNCHVFMQTGGQLPTDAGDILANTPPIPENAKPPHRDRGQCVNCHAIISGVQLPTDAGGQLPPDASSTLANPPPITKNAKAPHAYRGQCATCHTIR